MKIALIVFLICWPLMVAAQTPVPAPPFAPPGKLIDIGGYRLHLNCTGNKSPTVVLIAGAGDFSFDWSLVQPGIAQFANCGMPCWPRRRPNEKSPVHAISTHVGA